MGDTVATYAPLAGAVQVATGTVVTVQLDNSADDYVLASLNLRMHPFAPLADSPENVIVAGVVQPGWALTTVQQAARQLLISLRRTTPYAFLPGNQLVAFSLEVSDTATDVFTVAEPGEPGVGYSFRTVDAVVTVAPVTPPLAPTSDFIVVEAFGPAYQTAPRRYAVSVGATSTTLAVNETGFMPGFEGSVTFPTPTTIRIAVRRIGNWIASSIHRVTFNIFDSGNGNANNAGLPVNSRPRIDFSSSAAPAVTDPAIVSVTIHPALFGAS